MRVVKRVRNLTNLGTKINSASGRISDSLGNRFRDRQTFKRAGNGRARAQAEKREQEMYKGMMTSYHD